MNPHLRLYAMSFVFLALIICLVKGHGHTHDHAGHSHSHGHSHENFEHSHPHTDERPSFKYSKKANDLHAEETVVKVKSRDTLTLWAEALGSTLLISAAPFVILFFIPIDNRAEHEPFLKVLLSFASGGLLGDAFLHLIPHALLSHSDSSGGHSHSHSHSDHSGGSEVAGHDLSVGLGVLGGIVVFLMVEKFVRIVKGGHGHSHVVAIKEMESEEKEKPTTVSKEDDEGNEKGDNSSKDREKEEENTVSKDEESKHSDNGHDEDDIKVAGYLNLAADFTHNFTDGLAIGASYLAGSGVGLITTITILCHEVPHEIGDFAILIQSGCSKRKAILLQLLTAVGALTGTACSLFAEGIDARVSNLILPFTAGGFIYIATVSVIPELLQDTKFWQSVKEVIALLFGVFMMVVIAQYE